MCDDCLVCFRVFVQKLYYIGLIFMFVCIICDIQEEVAKEFGVPVQFQRFWLWAKRQNHTYRPNRPLTHAEEAQTVIFLACLEIFHIVFSLLCSPYPFL